MVYQFYSDIEQPNRMDDKPFFVFSMDTIKRTDPATLERFSRNQFNIDDILAEAGRLKLESLIRIELEREFATPSDDLIKLFAGRVQTGRLTASVREQFGSILAASIAGIIRDRVNERLTSALNVANPSPDPIVDGGVMIPVRRRRRHHDGRRDRGVPHHSGDRGEARRSGSRRHPGLQKLLRGAAGRQQPQDVGQLHFNSVTTRYVGTFSGKSETRHLVSSLTDLYKLENEIVARIGELETKGEVAA